jgi:hypothetical protein
MRLAAIAGALQPADIGTKRFLCSRLKSLMALLGMFNTTAAALEDPVASFVRNITSCRSYKRLWPDIFDFTDGLRRGHIPKSFSDARGFDVAFWILHVLFSCGGSQTGPISKPHKKNHTRTNSRKLYSLDERKMQQAW